MHPIRRRRIIRLTIMLLGMSSAIALALYALQQNINLYFTPTQILAGDAPKNHDFYIGGIVKPGSIHFSADGKIVRFLITDQKNQIAVTYQGILPDLFRAGQGIVVEGNFNQQKHFIAEQVLAKHGANYHPKRKIV